MRRRCATSRDQQFWVHACDDPFGCALASLSGGAPRRLPAGWRPGDRVAWQEGGQARSGEVWAAAPGRAVWVVPDHFLPQDRAWGLPRVKLP